VNDDEQITEALVQMKKGKIVMDDNGRYILTL
jgi:hypothetical protein